MNDFHSAYGLDANPFRLTPDRRFRFLHSAYTEAADCMRRGIQNAAGIVMITGKPGTGKTTLVAELVAELDSAGARSALLTSTQLDVDDLLRMIAHAYGLNPKAADQASVAAELDRFLQHQAEARRRTVLIVDEAQNLSIDALDALGTLSTLHHDERPLLEIVLLGQDQLLDKLRDPALQPLTERIAASAQLHAMAADETCAYIEHRLKQAGWQGKPAFSEDAYTLIHLLSGGLPRYVNKLCARLLVYGSIDDKARLGSDDVLTVGREMRDELLVPAFDDGEIASTLVSQVPALESGPEEQPARAFANPAQPAAAAADIPPAKAPSIDRAYGTPRTATETAAQPARQREQTAAGPVTGRADTGAEVAGNRQAKRDAKRPIDIALRAMLALLILAVAYGSWRYRPALLRTSRSAPPQPPARTAASGAAGAVATMTPSTVLSNHAPRDARPDRAPSPTAQTAEISGPAETAGGIQRDSTAVPAQAPAKNPTTIAPPAPTPASAQPPTRPASQLPQPPTVAASHSLPATQSAHKGGSGVITHKPSPAARGDSTPSGHRASPAAPGNGVDTPPHPQAPAPGAAVTNSVATTNNTPSEPTLAALGAKAKAAFEAYCLTIPADGSAYYYYRLMLARAPHDAQALNGLQHIVQRYIWLAGRALANREYVRAGHYISRGLVVNPGDAPLLNLRHQLDTQLSQAGAGKIGQAARTPGEPTTPPALTPNRLHPDTHRKGPRHPMPASRGNHTHSWISLF